MNQISQYPLWNTTQRCNKIPQAQRDSAFPRPKLTSDLIKLSVNQTNQPINNISSPDALIEQLIRQSQGIFLGEYHGDPTLRNWLSTSMSKLKTLGITTIYSEFDINSGSKYQPFFQAASNAGIKVHHIDVKDLDGYWVDCNQYFVNDWNNPNTTALEYEQIMLGRNNEWEKFILQNPPSNNINGTRGKYLVFGGAGHAGVGNLTSVNFIPNNLRDSKIAVEDNNYLRNLLKQRQIPLFEYRTPIRVDP
ncbi:MAG: hypothetical protein SFU25_10065 [Candidatus Caenarcaniphilales bacterium]|nr:hypothetical protein [Candidatus Caenarcaniphilales bacterium]